MISFVVAAAAHKIDRKSSWIANTRVLWNVKWSFFAPRCFVIFCLTFICRRCGNARRKETEQKKALNRSRLRPLHWRWAEMFATGRCACLIDQNEFKMSRTGVQTNACLHLRLNWMVFWQMANQNINASFRNLTNICKCSAFALAFSGHVRMQSLHLSFGKHLSKLIAISDQNKLCKYLRCQFSVGKAHFILFFKPFAPQQPHIHTLQWIEWQSIFKVVFKYTHSLTQRASQRRPAHDRLTTNQYWQITANNILHICSTGFSSIIRLIGIWLRIHAKFRPG